MDPNLGDAHYRLGLLDLKNNEPVAAYGQLQRASELMPGSDEVFARLGQLALTLYNADPSHPRQLYDQAGSAARLLLSRNVDSFDGNLIQGAIALADKKPAEAVLSLRKAASVKPDDLNAQLGLARALAQNNQAQDGVYLAQGLLLKNKAFGPAYDFLYEEYEITGKKDDAENILKLKVTNNPREAAYIVELARFYAAEQKPSEVDATIARLVARPADFPDGRMMAGDFYLSVGKPDPALEQFHAGLSSNPAKQAAYRKRIARILVSQKKWPEALQQIDAVLKEQPNDDEAKLMRAFVWLDEGDAKNLGSAISELQTQSKEHPNDPALHFQTGNALARERDQEGARLEWTAAAKASRTYLPARYSLVQLDLAQGKAPDALRISEEIVAIAPRDVAASLLHISCLTAAGQYDRARTELARLQTRFPQSPQVLFRLGVLDIAERRYKEAEDTFGRIAGAGSKNPEVSAGLAEAFEGENQGGRAIQILEDELKRAPNSQVLRRVLARIAVLSGRYDLVVDQYTELAAADPNSTPIQLSLAAAYSAKGDLASAQQVLWKVTKADPKSVPALLLLAQSLVATGRTGEAMPRYRHILEMDPNNANALNDLAYLMADSGENLDLALSYAQRGMRYTTDPLLKTSLADTLGWIYVKKNMTDSALQTFRNLVRSDPGNATFRYHLGTALYQKGDKQGARTELEAALADKPGSMDARKIKELLGRL
jgi:predicted Zn-dependent protease